MFSQPFPVSTNLDVLYDQAARPGEVITIRQKKSPFATIAVAPDEVPSLMRALAEALQASSDIGNPEWPRLPGGDE